MTPELFVKTYMPEAKKIEKETGFSAIAQMTQGALESGWGKMIVGNSFFGVKDTDGVNGNEILITTTEYSSKQNLKFPNILSVVPVVMKDGRKMFKYTIQDYFRKYNTPADCFRDHIQFFLKNPRYAEAVKHKADYNRFFEEIARAGYATAPDYEEQLKSVAKSVIKRM